MIIAALAGSFEIGRAQGSSVVLTSGSLSSNQFQFTLNGQVGATYSIQASSNLLNWVTVASNVSPGVVSITNPPSGKSFYRAVGTSASQPAFALLALADITISGGTVDSFNSALGGYDVVTNRNALATIATDSQATNAVTLGSSRIYGKVFTGPGGGISIAADGAIGDVSWNAANNGIQPGSTNDNINIALVSNAPPAGPFLTPTTTVVGGSNITYLDTGVYQQSSVNTSGAWIVRGQATLFVPGSLTVVGSGSIEILPGASLTVYVGGQTSIAGNGVINDTGRAANFSYIGLNSNGTFLYSGAHPLIGTVNAPQTDFIDIGQDVTGSIIGRSIYFSSGASMHYDESLAH